MGKLQKIKLSSAKEIILKSENALRFFKGKNFLAYQHISKSYPAYDKKFFYPKFKPYILGEKKIDLLIYEEWIIDNKIYVDARKKELKRFYEFCAGDPEIWENTYGTPCPV